MDDEELMQDVRLESEEMPQRNNPYDILMRQSRKMGSAATKTYDVTREFLKKDVSTVYPDKLRFPKTKKVDDTMAMKRGNLRSIVKKSHEMLAYATTVILPMNLFPDTITIDRTKVTIHKRTFFWSSQVISIRIEDVLNVSGNFGPLFGSIMISSRVMNSTDHFEVNYLWRSEAIYIKQLLQGYMIAIHNEIDVADLGKDELIETLLELGQDDRG